MTSWHHCRSIFVVVLLVFLQLARIQGRLQIPRERIRQPSLSTQNKDNPEILHGRQLASSHESDTTELLQREITLNKESKVPANDECSRAYSIVPEDIVSGNTDFASVDRGVVNDCFSTDYPGIWYYTIGTGQVLRASLVQDNHTEIVVFKGSDCDSLTCANSKVPLLADTNADSKSYSGWTTFWGTEVGETYYLYIYGRGSFQMILTQQKRPDNDNATGAIALQVGDSLQGSTAFASSDKDISSCDSPSNAPGVWFSISGTGSPLQSHLRTAVEGYRTQVTIYTASMECVENIQRTEFVDTFFDNNSQGWYPVSHAAVWETEADMLYYIMVHGPQNDSPGWYETENFELSLHAHERPHNDNCSSASPLWVGKTISSTTSFATIDDVLVCSPVSSSEKPTAPGIWYELTGVEGLLEITVASAYSAQLTIFTGDQCSNLVCVDGTKSATPEKSEAVISISASIKWDAKKDEIYYILVHGSDNLVGGFDLSLATVELSTETPESGGQNSTVASADTFWEVETRASLSFGFFPAVFIKEPSSEEVNALMGQTSKFFSKVFEDAYDDAFVRFQATAYDISMNDGTAFPVVISLKSVILFETETAAPTSEEAFNLMDQADFQTFIRNYAWQTEPIGGNMFFQTLRVDFGYAKSEPETGSLTDDSQAKAVQRVDAKFKVYFSFFPDSDLRAPTETEVDSLVYQTTLFLEEILQAAFDDYVRVGASATDVAFTVREKLPIVVYLDVHAFFALPPDDDSAIKALHTPTDLVGVMEDATLGNYIQNYVWETEPFGQNIFYETMNVLLRADDADLSETISSSTEAPSAEKELEMEYTNVKLYFNFHNTSTIPLRMPRTEEVDGLIARTDDFFTELLQDELPKSNKFAGLSMVSTKVDFDKGAKFPIIVYAVVEVMFYGKDHPTPEKILALMETADITEYVEYFVWFSEPIGSVFFAVNQAVLEPYVLETANASIAHNPLVPDDDGAEIVNLGGSTPDESATADPSTLEATLVPIETDIVVMFSFFRRNSYRGATEIELESLTDQTQMFFTKVLKETYDDLVRLDLNIITAGFEEQEQKKPSVVSWTVNALFYVLDGTGSSRTPEKIFHVLTSSNVEDYLHNYVWSAAPMGANYFFDAIEVQFDDEVGTSETTDTEDDGDLQTPAPTDAPTSEVVIRYTMLYGFLKDQVIDRDPNDEEKDAILYQTSLFFNKLFRDNFSDSFKKANVSIRDVTLVEGDSLPIIVSYEMIAIFQDVASVPSSEDLYQVMESANFQSYIEFYVWNAEALDDGMFFDTQKVVFQTLV